ncbi:MAG: hypothetical protein EZS28_007310, partial [Streblomastix strix]
MKSNNNLLLPLVLIIYILTRDLLDVSGIQIYVSDSRGSDGNSCDSTDYYCKTLNADNILANIRTSSADTIYIDVYSTLTSNLNITQYSPQVVIRSLTDAQCTLLIDITAYFIIRGNVSFEGIKFTQTAGVTYHSGGVIYASLSQQYHKLEIQNCIFEGTKGTTGGAIYGSLTYLSQVNLTNCQFKNCYGSQSGGGVYLTAYVSAGTCSMSNIEFDTCSSIGSGGGMYYMSNVSDAEINGIRVRNCEAQRGGGLYLSVYKNFTIKGVCSFTGCKTAGISSGSGPLGGAIYLITTFETGQFNFLNATFDSCTCSQPGCGGAIYIDKQNASIILFNNLSFINCKTVANETNATQGFGGAIFINTTSTTAAFSSDNHIMTNLVFTGCQSVFGAGHNLHIISSNTTDTGSIIKSNSLITVNGTSNLYTSSEYYYDYMGIDATDYENGKTDLNLHKYLFDTPAFKAFLNPQYVNSGMSSNYLYCGTRSTPCRTIANILGMTKDSYSNYPSGTPSINIVMLGDNTHEANLQINTNTNIGNNITIQSNGYNSGGTGYTKYKISSTSNSNSLFQITTTGRLELLGLLFDNLAAGSTNPLISASTSTTSSYCFTTISCEFALAGSQNLAHSIISVNGGKISIQKTSFINYKFSGTITAIVIQSASSSSIVELEQVAFTDITQSGTGNGAAINSVLNSGSSLKTSVSSNFTRCKANGGSGGAIYSTLSGGQIELNQTQFISCESKSGGAVYSTISGAGKL